jgi:GT2 family glycosyltransferase
MVGNSQLLSVIIPTYEREDDVRNLLSSLKQDINHLEIIVVDDCSPNPSIFDSIKADYQRVKFIHSEKNAGPGASRNIGAKLAKGEFLLFLDSDTKLVNGSIDILLQFINSRPEVNVCTGWDHPTPISSGFFPRFKALFQVSVAPRSDCEVSYVAGRCFAVRRSAMLEIGGFDTNYAAAEVEDYELGYRINEKFGPIWFLTNLRVHHRYPSFSKQFVLYFRRTIQWIDLRSKQKQFDNSMGTSRIDALINIFSALIPFVFITCYVSNYVIVAGVFLIIATVLNYRFLHLCWQEEGSLFMVRAVICHSLLANAICAGAVFAICKNKLIASIKNTIFKFKSAF